MTNGNLSPYFQNFLHRVGKYPLLTHEQEISLGRTIRAYLDGESTDRAKYLKARHKFINSNLRLCIHVAKKFSSFNLSLEDRAQLGAIGLARAVDKFDPSKGYRFSTYAYAWVWQEITRGESDTGTIIRVPPHARNRYQKIAKFITKYTQENGRNPGLKTIADALGMNPHKVLFYLEVARNQMQCKSLNFQAGHDGDAEVVDFIESTEPDGLEVLQYQNTVDLALSSLSEREQFVLLERVDGKTGLQIADRLNCSIASVRTLESRARKKAKAAIQFAS